MRRPCRPLERPFIEFKHGFGRVIRRDANGTAVRMSRYHFQRLADVHTEYEHLFGKAMIQ